MKLCLFRSACPAALASIEQIPIRCCAELPLSADRRNQMALTAISPSEIIQDKASYTDIFSATLFSACKTINSASDCC